MPDMETTRINRHVTIRGGARTGPGPSPGAERPSQAMATVTSEITASSGAAPSTIPSANSPMGMLMRKIERQPMPEVSAPPTSGPTANQCD